MNFLKMHQKCIKSASKVHQKCIKRSNISVLVGKVVYSQVDESRTKLNPPVVESQVDEQSAHSNS